MNDDFFKKLAGITNAYDKFESISGLSKATLAATGSVSNLLHNDITQFATKDNFIGAFQNNGSNVMQKILSNNIYYEPIEISPLKAAMASIMDLVNIPKFDANNNINWLTLDIPKFQPPIDGKFIDFNTSFLDISKIFDINWRESYPNFNYEKIIDDSIEVVKFKENLSSNETPANLNDGLIATLSLDSENIDDLSSDSIEIFKIANETLASITNSKVFDIEVYNEFIEKLSKYKFNKHFVNLMIAIVGGVISALIVILIVNNVDIFKNQLPQNTAEEVISETIIPVTKKPIKNYKVFYKIPIGCEIEIIKKFKVYTRIAFTDSDGVYQIGYCTINEIEKGAK